MTYTEFLDSKRILDHPSGFEPESLNQALFPFQRDIVRWALRRGRAALFEDCGMGKTLQQLEWANLVSRHQKRPVLILAPLAVAEQTAREGERFGIAVTLAESMEDIKPGVNISNYEKLHRFHPAFAGIVLDESSILKAFDGKTRTQLIDFSRAIPFRLAATATPSPNDFTELGNHAEFLGVMNMPEMLATFFVHDGGETSKWRLKGHAEEEFWKWVASWAVMLRKPSDLGYSDDGFILPPLSLYQHTIPIDTPEWTLFTVEARSLNDRREARRDSLQERVTQCAHMVNGSNEQWLIWCDLNAESDALYKSIPDSYEVRGSDSAQYKKGALLDFAAGNLRVLVSKPWICGFGMNFQLCHNIAFVGLSDSFEAFYQAVRRCWRFGQTHPVECHIICAETEGAVVRNIERKEKQAEEMARGMVKHMARINQENIHGAVRETVQYERMVKRGNRWEAHLGDCVEVCREQADESVDFIIYSPPFASLYTYSNSDRDIGNVRDYEEFEEHYNYLVPELYRMLKPGRLLSFHCMNLALTKERDGVIGIRDFRGELIRIHQAAGFIFHSEVCIWKDPVTAMQRTKAIGLLYKQLRKDSAMSRQAIPDYLVTMRKPGENLEPVTKTHEGFPVSLWQRYASPVWMDINASDTLQRESAREEKDERHIAPLQLGVIRRALELWTNPGDLVFSPFGGIGSEGYVALQLERRACLVELKRSYWEQACLNLESAEATGVQNSLLAEDESA
jgi:hypothetical protein